MEKQVMDRCHPFKSIASNSEIELFRYAISNNEKNQQIKTSAFFITGTHVILTD